MNGVVIASSHQEAMGLLVRGAKLIGPLSTDSLNHHAVLYADLVSRYTRVLRKCAQKFECESIEELSSKSDFVLLCLPGAATAFDKQIVLSLLVRCGWSDGHLQKIHVVDDTWAGAVAATKENRVIYGIADAGSSVFVFSGGFPEGRNAKFDGWGALIGDHGSQFQLALDALRLICRDLDRGKPRSLLAVLQEHDEDLRLLPDLQLWFDNLLNHGHTIWRHKISELATPILRVADESPGDFPDALKLVQDAALSFADTIDLSIRGYVPDSHKMEIVVGGSMMTCLAFRAKLADEIQKRFSMTVRPSEFTIVAGAILLALSLPSKVPSEDVRSRVIGYFEKASEPVARILYEPWSRRGRKRG